MTDEQFQKMMGVLSEMNSNIKLIISKETGKELYGLSDVFSELSSILTAVNDVESAIKRNN